MTLPAETSPRLSIRSDRTSNILHGAGWEAMVDWLLAPDLGGLFVVLTRHASHKFARIHMDTRHHLLISAIGFYPQRGLIQGDVKSPLRWIAFFDILLDALKIIATPTYTWLRLQAP